MAYFNKRHYQFIAKIMQECRKEYPGNQEMINAVCLAMAEAFGQDNPLFKGPLFMQATQIGSNVRARKVA